MFGGKRIFAPAVAIAGLAGSAVFALSTTGTMSAFTASIENSVNNSGTQTLTMQETNGSTTCNSTDGGTNNSATCSSINKYGGGMTLYPGGPASVTTVTIKNTGTMTPTAFTLTPGTCSQSGSGLTDTTAATDLCSQMTVAVYAASSATGTPLYTGPLSGLTTQTLTALAPGATQDYTFSVSLPAGVGGTTTNNTYQNISANQTLTWTFSS